MRKIHAIEFEAETTNFIMRAQNFITNKVSLYPHFPTAFVLSRFLSETWKYLFEVEVSSELISWAELYIGVDIAATKIKNSINTFRFVFTVLI